MRGPDITPALEQTLANVRDHFAKLNTLKRGAVCNNLLSPAVGLVAWDIAHLHAGLEWLEQVRPECATVGDTPACEKTVQVKDQCFYVGSVNYVVFGVMMRLCHDSQPVQAPFGLTATESMVRGYKGIPGMTAGNLEPSVNWSVAGFNGWPGVGVPTPPGDRQNLQARVPQGVPGSRSPQGRRLASGHLAPVPGLLTGEELGHGSRFELADPGWLPGHNIQGVLTFSGPRAPPPSFPE